MISAIFKLAVGVVLMLGLILTGGSIYPLNFDCFPRVQLASNSKQLSDDHGLWQLVNPGGGKAVFGIAQGQSGGLALTVTANSVVDSKDAMWLSPVISVSEGQYFRFEDLYRSSVTSELQIRFGAPDLSPVRILVPPSGKCNLQRLSHTFRIPRGARGMSVGHALAGAGELLTEQASLTSIHGPEFTRGIVSITFDDGWKSALRNAVPILEAAVSDTHPNGLRTTQYIVTKGSLLQPDKYRRYLTPEDVLLLHKNGHDIASHTRSHADLVHEIGDEEGLEAEIGGSYEDFLRYQLPAPLSMAYPYGRHDNEVMRVVASRYFAGRGVNRGLNFADSNPYSLRTQLIQRHTTVNEITRWIDEALAKRAWLILSLHSVEPTIAECVHPDSNEPDEECTDVATVKALADYLKDTPTGTVMTVRDMLNDKVEGKGEVWLRTQQTSN